MSESMSVINSIRAVAFASRSLSVEFLKSLSRVKMVTMSLSFTDTLFSRSEPIPPPLSPLPLPSPILSSIAESIKLIISSREIPSVPSDPPFPSDPSDPSFPPID